MDAHSIAQGIVVIFLIGVGFCLPAFADPAPIVYPPDVGRIYGQDFNLPLLDPVAWGESAMTEALIDVVDHFVVTDLDVRINITHTNIFDLQLLLESPLGTRICLNMYDWEKGFFIDPNYTNTVFDDEAPVSIKEGEPPFNGRFRPIEPYELSKFDDANAYGLWQLQIYDMWPTDTGTLDRLYLIFNTPEPATAILLMFATCLAILKRPRGQMTTNLWVKARQGGACSSRRSLP